MSVNIVIYCFGLRPECLIAVQQENNQIEQGTTCNDWPQPGQDLNLGQLRGGSVASV